MRQDFTPSNRYIKALNYVRGRRLGLEVFLTDPDVPIDTNYLERALRVVPMGELSKGFDYARVRGCNAAETACFLLVSAPHIHLVAVHNSG